MRASTFFFFGYLDHGEIFRVSALLSSVMPSVCTTLAVEFVKLHLFFFSAFFVADFITMK